MTVEQFSTEMANLYTGWLGSVGSKNVDQSAKDIHFTDWSAAGPVVKHRLHTQCANLGITVVSGEMALPPLRPDMQNVWVPNAGLLPFLGVNTGGADGPIVFFPVNCAPCSGFMCFPCR